MQDALLSNGSNDEKLSSPKQQPLFVETDSKKRVLRLIHRRY